MNAEENEEFERDQTEMRLALFHDRRPAAFAARGWLDRDVHSWLEGMVRGESRSLLIGGPTGTGKSWSLWKSVETLLVNGWRGKWEIITATDFRDITAPPVDDARLDRIRRCEFLGLDDVGAWRVSDWAADQLYGLIDFRWAHHLPIMLATNEDDLDSLLGERITSRLADGMEQVVLDGPDRRTS